MIKVGVVGCGHWGPNHIRVFSQLKDTDVVMCADLEDARLQNISSNYPDIEAVKDYKKILNNKDIDAVCITTPTNTHYKLTKEALEANKHVLCEKPLTLESDESEELKALAQKNKKILMVGHVFIFNAGINWLKEYIKAGELGSHIYDF